MAEFECPTYVIALANSLNRAHIESAKPDIPINLLVVPENDLTSKPIRATGVCSTDGTSFSVQVATTAGTQAHTWIWDSLKNAIHVRRNK